MSKAPRPSTLQAVLEQARMSEPPPAMDEGVAPPTTKRSSPKATAEGSADRRPSRDGKRFIGGYFEPKVQTQLKIIAAEDGTTVQDLVEEALNLLFVKKGKGSIIRQG